nr:hypothetical protein [Tanacetum cinerariifolium]
MDAIRAQQKALDDELGARANCLKIGKSNLRLSFNRAQQKALDDELGARANRLKIGKSNLRLSSNLKSKEPTLQVLNGKSHTVNIDNFRDMLKICPKLHGQTYEEPPLEEDILSFIRDLGHTGEIKFLSDVNVNHMHQPWRSFAAIINKCLSGKTTALESLRLSLRVISKHHDTQVYGAILPHHLTNQAMLESEACVTYRAYATSEKTPKPKTTKKKANSKSSPKPKPTQLSRQRLSKDEDDDEVGVNKEDDENNNDDDDNDNDDANDDDDDDANTQDAENQDDDDEKTDSDNDGDDFVHPKVQTPSHVESTDDEDNADEIQGANVEGKEMDAQQSNVQTTQVTEDTHVIITPVNAEGQQQSSSVSSGFISNTLNPTPDVEQVKAQVFKILLKNEKTVNEQLEAKVLTRSSIESKTSHAIAANLSELELKKILIDKMESNKLIHKSDEQNNLYKALVDAYESDKLILNTYGDTVSFKRRRDDKDKDEEPSVGSNRWSKRRRAGKEPESTNAPKEKTPKTTSKSTEGSRSHHKSTGKFAYADEPMHTAKDLEELTHQEFETGATEDQPDAKTSQLPDWFQKLARPPTPDRNWNKTLPDAHRSVQPRLSSLAQMEGLRESFNELMDTPLDFSAFVMNRLKVDTLTPELLAGPTFELMKESCKSLTKLEYFIEEVYKATTKQLD